MQSFLCGTAPLTSGLSDVRVMGEHTIVPHFSRGFEPPLSPGIWIRITTGALFHLRCAWRTGISLGPEPQLAAADSARRAGAAALSGNYIVDMLPQEDTFSVRRRFISAGGQQTAPAGCAELAPGGGSCLNSCYLRRF